MEMRKATTAVFRVSLVLVLVLGSGLLVTEGAIPASLYSPGDLHADHQGTGEGCAACHLPWQKVSAVNCTTGNCHTPEKLEEADIGTKGISGLHRNSAGEDCMACHTEHLGADGKITPIFDHGVLTEENRNKCFVCHGPGSPEHKGDYGENCLQCHTGNDWKEIVFRHDQAEQSCVTCHKGPENNLRHQNYGDNCAQCHNTNEWEEIQFDHDKLTDKKCLPCHQNPQKKDHNFGDQCYFCHSTKTWDNAKVDHSQITGQSCSSCHKAPNDRTHSKFSGDCSSCHSTRTWDGAKIDHNRLAGQSCASCHQAPNDADHRSYGNDCANCHNTNNWGASAINHNQYFPLTGEHWASCRTCHPNSYKQYTCLGCHEHNNAKLQREHNKEGIYEYGDCLRCHKGGDLDDDHDNRRRRAR